MFVEDCGAKCLIVLHAAGLDLSFSDTLHRKVMELKYEVRDMVRVSPLEGEEPHMVPSESLSLDTVI